MSASRWDRVRRIAGWSGATVTFVLSVVGAYTGTKAWQEARRVDIRLVAEPHEVNFFEDSSVLHVGIVNSSQRGVVLDRGRVLAFGRKIGTVSRLLPDEASGAASPRDLPYTLPGQSSLTANVELVLDVGEVRDGLVRRLERRIKQASRTSLTLELSFRPGGIERIDVPLRSEESGLLGLSTLEQPPWRVLVLATNGQSQSLILRNGAGGPRTPEVARLQLWGSQGRRGRPIATITRPVQAPLPLPKGASRRGYEYALSVGGEVVSTGGLVGPMRR